MPLIKDLIRRMRAQSATETNNRRAKL